MKRNLKTLMVVLMMIACVSCLLLVSCTETVEYTVTYSSNGTTTQEKVEENTVHTLTTPTLADHEFQGWYLTEDFSGEQVTSLTVTADVTVYAKWERLYSVTLDLDGGSLATQVIKLKNGESVYSAVQSLVPTKTSAQFDAWLLNGSAISSSLKINGADISLTASYKYAYRIEVYQQTMDGTSYQKVAQDIEGFATAGTQYSPEYVEAGFVKADHENTVDTLTISKNAADNVYKLYFDRKDITVTFQMDYPDGSFGEDYSVELIYGNSVTVPVDYEFEGYYLLGWGPIPDDDATYKTNTVESNLYNKTSTAAQPDSFVPTEDMTLYPIWVKGYTDMFGGGDSIFVFDTEGDVCYMVRGGVWFVGTYYAEDGSFEFLISDDKILQGKVDTYYNSFYFLSDERSEFSAFEFAGGSLYATRTVTFDKEIGISYKVMGENNAISESKGTYVIDENGRYVVTFTSGELAGQTRKMIVGVVSTNVGKVNAFQWLGEEADYGKLVRFVVYDGYLTYYTSAYFIEFDGAGTALYYQSSTEYAEFDYVKNEDGTYSLYSDGSLAGTFKVMTVNVQGVDVMGYMLASSSFTMVANDGSSLSVDGYCEATYTSANGNTEKGYYSLVTGTTQMYDGYVVFYASSGARYFYVTVETAEDGSPVYNMVEKSANYAEFLYRDEVSTYYAPLIVFNDNGEGTIDVYGYTNKREYVKVSSGTYSFDQNTGLYTYVETTSYPFVAFEEIENEDGSTTVVDGVYTNIVDYAQIKSFVFAVDTTTGNYDVTYWYSYTYDNDQTTDLTVVYTCSTEAGTMTLTFVGGAVVFTNINGVSFVGYVYDQQNNLYVLALQYNGSYAALYVEIDEENKTFITYDHAPYSAYQLLENGAAYKDCFLQFDGKGGVVYQWVERDENGEIINTTVYTGSSRELEETAFITGYKVYLFEGETEEGEKISFKYIVLAINNVYYFGVYNNEVNGTFYAKEGEGSLTLDGFGYAAEYIPGGTGETAQLVYYIPEENVICLGGRYYFDIDLATRTYTLRGTEYGSYLLIDNQSFNGIYLSLDGYGKLTVFTSKVNEETGETERVDVDVNGTYVIGEDIITLTYVDGAKTITLYGLLGYYTVGDSSYYAFYVQYKEVETTLINPEDWSMIILDGFGHAIRHDAEGQVEQGTYVIVSDKVMYYVNNAASYACIYTYDVANGTAIPSNFSQRGYYTESLESLLFSQYGFAIFGGKERLYYSIENNQVTIYRHDPSNENANKYGYVAENFGSFAEVITYEGQQYYQNSGYNILFTREEEGKDLYPVLLERDKKYPLEALSFTPGGAKEFSVSGTVVINGETYKCTVVRELNEETNAYEVYVYVGTYKFAVDVTFKGEDNASYSVTSMALEINAYSESWLYMYVIYYMFLGVQIPDTMGMVHINGTYDEEGELTDSYLTTAFLETSGILDYNGNLINVENAEFSTKGGVYYATIVGADGYTYKFEFTIAVSNYVSGVMAYTVKSFSRVQTLTNGDYTLEIERAIYSDMTSAGAPYRLTLRKGDEVYTACADTAYLKTNADGSILMMSRKYNDFGRIIDTDYVTINLTNDADRVIEGETDEDDITIVPLYSSFEVVSIEEVETIYNAVGDAFVDVIISAQTINWFSFTQYDEEGNPNVGFYSAKDTDYYASANVFVFNSGVDVVAVISVDGEGNKTAIIKIVSYVSVEGDEATGVYFELDLATGAIIPTNALAVKYQGEIVRPEGDNYDKLNNISAYKFVANGKNYVYSYSIDSNGALVVKVDEVYYIYAANTVDYIAISKRTGKAVIFKYQNREMIVSDSTFDEATNTYVLVTNAGSYSVKVIGAGEDATIEISVA